MIRERGADTRTGGLNRLARKHKRPPAVRAKPPQAAHAGPAPRWVGVAVALAVAAALSLRLLAARGDLWLDEVWTLGMLAELRSPFEILTKLRHDNNHLLNSLCMWWLSPYGDFVMRLPAALLGGLGVAAAAWCAALADDGSPASSPPGSPDLPASARALLATLLLGGSFLLVHYGSEARGYAGAVAFSLLAFAFAQKGRLQPTSPWALAYGLACWLALASHALAVHVVAGVLAWSLLRGWRAGLPGWSLARAVLVWNTLPVLGALLLYLGFLRHMAIGGGPEEGLAPVLGRTVAYAAGLPLGWDPELLLGLGALLLAAGAWALARRGGDVWICYVVTILISPALLQALQPGELHFERYFVSSAAFGLLLLARALGLLAARGLEGALVAGLCTLACLGGSAPRVERLLDEQRGHYRAALRLMLAESPAGRVTVSSDHDFRNGLLLRHYAGILGVQDRLVYWPQASWQAEGPDWFVCHRLEGEPGPAGALQDPPGNRYELRAEYPSAPLSGFRWYLFRRVGRRAPGLDGRGPGADTARP